MRRVLRELDRVGKRFETEPVHRLRVALRQSRSLIDVLSRIEPDPCWRDVKKAAKKLFQRLGDLRDVQVMAGWLETLSRKGRKDPLVRDLLDDLARREKKLKARARRAARSFDRSAWKGWIRRFAARYGYEPALEPDPDSRDAAGDDGCFADTARPSGGRAPSVDAFRYLALVRWSEARRLHGKVLKGASRETWHELRIALKRFRYVVESFLPDAFSKWSGDLKALQDLLGEIHDLDILDTLVLERAPDGTKLGRKIAHERAEREAGYRARTGRRPSLWAAWRRELPDGSRLRDAALARLEAWARSVDPGFAKAARLRGAALEVLEALRREGIAQRGPSDDARHRTIVEAAALLHGIGGGRARNGAEQEAWRTVQSIEPPLGWSPEDLQAVACAIREEPRASAGKKVRTAGLPAGVAREARTAAVLLKVARALSERSPGAPRVSVTGEGALLRFDALDPRDGHVLTSATAERAEME
jgi:CHAD domain-containing protein